MKLDQEYEVVDVERLKEHPQNPKRGVVEVIDDSIEINGWYGAVVAQKSTGFILVGNHRYRAAVARGAEQIPVIWRDVDNDVAMRILLVDNKSSDLGTYDEELLTELLEGLTNLNGTGFDSVLAAVEEAEDAAEPPVPDDKYEPSWGVMVVCDSEDDQRETYEQLEAMGLKLRVVAV